MGRWSVKSRCKLFIKSGHITRVSLSIDTIRQGKGEGGRTGSVMRATNGSRWARVREGAAVGG